MDNVFVLILALAISLVLMIPLGIAGMYFFLALRQLSIGSKEQSRTKLKSGLTALMISGIAIILVLFVLGGIWLTDWL